LPIHSRAMIFPFRTASPDRAIQKSLRRLRELSLSRHSGICGYQFDTNDHLYINPNGHYQDLIVARPLENPTALHSPYQVTTSDSCRIASKRFRLLKLLQVKSTI
jgi:hypothetical protein